jgi:hypothetical protein
MFHILFVLQLYCSVARQVPQRALDKQLWLQNTAIAGKTLLSVHGIADREACLQLCVGKPCSAVEYDTLAATCMLVQSAEDVSLYPQAGLQSMFVRQRACTT